jgi:uncharacterized damage-inducible protein DinB
MTEPARIADQIRRAAHGDAWHGPSLAQAIEGVSAADAAARPIANAHSIWELVGHLRTWTRAVQQRFEGDHAEPTAAENFPAISGGDAKAWAAVCGSVLAAHDALVQAVLRNPDRSLDAMVPGHSYSAYVMLHGAVQHTLYHAGQIMLLRRALAQHGT